jgi:hypothetical protein
MIEQSGLENFLDELPGESVVPALQSSIRGRRLCRKIQFITITKKIALSVIR